jgi:hypothetical protein
MISGQIPSTSDAQGKSNPSQSATVIGPLANYVLGKQEPRATDETREYKATASDHVGDSVVGTSQRILHQTFSVRGTVKVPFEIPAHASMPQLRGTFRSFLNQADASDGTADVEFLLLTQLQYADLARGNNGDAVFVAEDSHNQEVNLHLAPTVDEPVKYYLVFRNNSRGGGKRVVQADFRIDF